MAIMVMRSSAGSGRAMKSTSGTVEGLSSALIVAGEPVAERGDACGLHAGMHVVGGELADGLLLLDVDEADFLAGDRRVELVIGDLLAFGAIEERAFRSRWPFPCRARAGSMLPQAPPAISR